MPLASLLICQISRVVCGIAIRSRVRGSDNDIRTQRDRVAADTPVQILFVDDFLPHFVFVHFPLVFPFEGFLLSYSMLLHYI